MRQVIEGLKERLQNVKTMKIFKSADLKLLFSDAHKLLFTPFCGSLGDEDKRFPLAMNVSKAFEESIILPQAPNRDFLLSLFEDKKFQTKLLFRGSKDGFTSAKFHSLCDNKGPTLVLVKSRLGYYFGGYSSTSWRKIIQFGQYHKVQILSFSL